MNQISPNLLPVAPAPSDSGESGTLSDAETAETTFDSLLRQSSEESPTSETAETPLPNHSIKSVAKRDGELPADPAVATLFPMLFAPTPVETAAAPDVLLADDALLDGPLDEQAVSVDSPRPNASDSGDTDSFWSGASSFTPQFSAPVITSPDRAPLRVPNPAPDDRTPNVPAAASPITQPTVVRSCAELTAKPVLTPSVAAKPGPATSDTASLEIPAVQGGERVLPVPAESADPAAPDSASLARPDELPVVSQRPAPAQPAPAATPAPQAEPSVPPQAAATGSEIFNGMRAAKPGMEMSAPPQSRPASPRTENSAELPAAAPERAVTLFGTSASVRSSIGTSPQSSGEQSFTANPETSTKPDAAAPNTPPAITDSAIPFPTTNITPATTSAEVKPADITHVVTQTIQATETLRASGQERIEVSVRLDGGQELTIEVRVANGQVTPLIRTESEPLRAALEQSWPSFASRAGANEHRITTPIFESPQTSSNMADPHSQREGRQRSFNEPAPEFTAFPQPRRATANPARPSASPSPASNGVRAYA